MWSCQILNQVVESQFFTSLWNRYHQWLPDIGLNQISVFLPGSHFRIYLCFIVGKRIGVWNCQEARGHRKTTIFTAIVYGYHKTSAIDPVRALTSRQGRRRVPLVALPRACLYISSISALRHFCEPYAEYFKASRGTNSCQRSRRDTPRRFISCPPQHEKKIVIHEINTSGVCAIEEPALAPESLLVW